MTGFAESLDARSLQARLRFPLSQFDLQVDVRVPPGVTMLFGASGSGKTTLLNALSGLTRPSEGQITLAGSTLFSSNARIFVPARHRKVGYVLQDLALFPHMTAAQNVAYGLPSHPERKQIAMDMLRRFRVDHLARHYPRQISGGERQRVALARALACEPRLLLLDEPLSALDVPTKQHIMNDLFEWNQGEQRIPILYVTHDRAEVFALGDHVLIMERGRIVAEGSPAQVLHAPRTAAMAQLAGIENVFEATVDALHEDTGSTTCRVKNSELRLECPLSIASVGESARIGIRAGDILLSVSEVHGVSARNRLSGTITAIHQGPEFVEVGVACGGVHFLVHVTRSATGELQLHTGQPVWLLIKTHSCHLLR